MKNLTLTIAACCLLTPMSASAQLPFLDGFEYCSFDETIDNPLLSTPVCSVTTSTYCTVDTDCPSGETCLAGWRIEGATLDTNSSIVASDGGVCSLGIAIAPSLSDNYIQRPTGGVDTLYAGFRLAVKVMNSGPNKMIAGNKLTNGGFGCNIQATRINNLQPGFGGGVDRYTLSLLYGVTGIHKCDNGSRNPGTVCTPDGNGDDTATCAETTIGEAKCNSFPYAVGSVNAADSSTPIWNYIAWDELHTGANVTCGLYINGRNLGTQAFNQGVCTKDSWACGTNADCQNGLYDGRCANWVLSNPYPEPDTPQRCRTSQGNADCPGSTCVINTCDISSVVNIADTFLGFNDKVDYVSGDFNSFTMYFDDWYGSALGPNPRQIRSTRINLAASSTTRQWVHNGCTSSNNYQCVTGSNDGSNLAATTEGKTEEFLAQSGTSVITLMDNSPCNGATQSSPGTCAVGGVNCFVDSDCQESIPINAPVTVSGLFSDDGEGVFENNNPNNDGGGTKSVTFELWQSGQSSVCPGATCVSGTAVSVGDNLGSEYRHDGESGFNKSWTGNNWTETELETLGVRMIYTNQPASQKRIRADMINIDVPIKLPDPVIPKVIPDINSDGFDTVCFTGDSTYANSELEAAIAGAISEPDVILMLSAGSKTLADVEYSIEDIMDGNASSSVIPGGLNAHSTRGLPCVKGDSGATCEGCDILFVGLGVNSHGSFNGWFSTDYCYAPRTAATCTNSICTAGRIGAACSVDSDCSQNGQPCICANGSGARQTAETGFCGDNYSPSPNKAFKSTCTIDGPGTDHECSTFNNSPGICALFKDTCTSGTCQDPFWAGLDATCTVNADCARLQQWCVPGCIDAPGCSEGICIGPRQSWAGMAQNWNSIAAHAKARNSDSILSNNIDVVFVSQPKGGFVGSLGSLGGVISPNTGCWGFFARAQEASASRLRVMAEKLGMLFLDHNYIATVECPSADSGQCTVDGIHYNTFGSEVASDSFRRCLINTDGTSDGICTSSVCTQGRVDWACSTNGDCDTYRCGFSTPATTTTTLP